MKFKSWENCPKMNSVLTNCVQSVTLIRSWGAMKIIRAEPPEMFTVHIPSQSLKLFTSGERLNSCAMLCSVTQCVRLCDPTGCSLPGSSLRRIPQARRLEWVGISFSRGSSWTRGCVFWVSCIGRQVLYHCAHSCTLRAVLLFQT